jgi:ATP-dependent Clp protease ATP-binding subunit ClpA
MVFKPLDKTKIKKIVEIGLLDIEKRLKNKSYSMTYDAKVINYITKNVYNPEY